MGFLDDAFKNLKAAIAASNHAVIARGQAEMVKAISAANAVARGLSEEEKVNETFKMVQEMIDLSEAIRKDSRLLSFQNYTRYYVSVKFLQDLVSQRVEIKSPADINLVFLNLIQKFLTDSISDSELVELDEQIQQL